MPFTGERTSLDDTAGYKLAHRVSNNVATNGQNGAELQYNQRATNDATKVTFTLVK